MTGHLHEFHSGKGSKELAGRSEDLIVTPEVASVMVGDVQGSSERLALLTGLGSDGGGSTAVGSGGGGSDGSGSTGLGSTAVGSDGSGSTALGYAGGSDSLDRKSVV